jgi:hypothetical protein
MILSCHQYITPRGAAHLPEELNPETALQDPDPMNLDPQHRFAFIDTARRHIIIDDTFMLQVLYNTSRGRSPP